MMESKLKDKTIIQVMSEVHDLARERGWWRDCERPDTMKLELSTNEILAKIALVITELAEAIEVARMPNVDLGATYYQVLMAPNGMLTRDDFVRDQGREPGPNDKPEGFGVELGDAVIRIFDLAAAMGIDLAALMELKHQYNKSRPMRHGGKRA